TNLAAGDFQFDTDVFVKDLQSGAVSMVSRTDFHFGTGRDPAISASGRHVAYVADNFGDTRIFVKDMVTGAETNASATAAGTAANGLSSQPSISGDGRLVAFVSSATNLVAGDTNGVRDVFVKNMLT